MTSAGASPYRGILRKSDYAFVPYRSLARVEFKGSWLHQDGHAIAMDQASALCIRLCDVTEVFGRFVRHDWSGKMKVTVNGRESDCFDLFSNYRFEQSIRLAGDLPRGECMIEITALGRNPQSKAQQMVFVGVFLRREETGSNLIDNPVSTTAPASGTEASYYEVQVGMVDRYVDGLISRGVELSVEAERRWSKYKRRFKEMLVYAAPGNQLLDIGAGFLIDEFVKSTLIANGIEYWVQDIDHRVVEADKAVFTRCGLDPSRVRQGTNSTLAYPDATFDNVFSSHCLEHSDNIDRTFSELRRVIKPGGILFYAVPIGYDDSLEHSNSMDAEAWYALTEQQGFAVINQHVGNTYTEGVHDLVIVAQRT